MVSPELLRSFPFFEGFDPNHLKKLSMAAKEFSFDRDHLFFRADEKLDQFYIVTEGRVGIIHETPDRGIAHTIASQLIGNVPMMEIVVSAAGRGELFGWSSLLPPFKATDMARALTACRVVMFDAVVLRQEMDDDSAFGYKMTLRLAQVIRNRLRDRQIELVAENQEILPTETP